MFRTLLLALAYLSSAVTSVPTAYDDDCGGDLDPKPPQSEPISLRRLPLPPIAPSSSLGACSSDINPHGTGCIAARTGLQAGSFLPDGGHILASVNFAGAPSSPDPASIYNGSQVIIIKSDGSLFSNGDAWKCITCGNSPSNSIVANKTNTDWSYAQAFDDGKRILAGQVIISCDFELTSDKCTPENTYVYPIRLPNNAADTGTGAMIRELRLHPDNVHIGLNSFRVTPAGSLDQSAFFGRLSFNAAPTTGLPLSPRYDLINVNLLFDRSNSSTLYAVDNELYFNHSAIAVGELRGFNGIGDEITYIGYPTESCNIDVFAVNIYDGAVRRLTTHPGYTDPVEFSPDGEWFVVMDTRGSGRTEFMDGLRWVPPVTDLVTSLACSSVRNNGDRRFFQPYLLDRHGDRGDYYGQSLNNGQAGEYGSGAFDDPQWNGRADPWFSPDGTKVVFWQAQVVSPACGGSNPLPCYESTELGGVDARIIIADLTSRKPLQPRAKVDPVPDTIPWAVAYTPGMTLPERSYPREGSYTLQGTVSGFASVEIRENAAKTGVQNVYIELSDYADEDSGVIFGYQKISAVTRGITKTFVDWFSNLTRSGDESGVQYTSPDGFHMSIDVFTNLFEANGTLITTIGDVTYGQPVNGG